MKKKEDLWIQDALKYHKEGSLHRMLGIQKEEKIPLALLNKIRKTEIGETIKNPSKKGKPKIKVTKLLKQRSVLAITLKHTKH